MNKDGQLNWYGFELADSECMNAHDMCAFTFRLNSMCVCGACGVHLSGKKRYCLPTCKNTDAINCMYSIIIIAQHITKTERKR